MKRVLVIRFSALGDVAMLAPIVRKAAEQYPDVAFTMLSQQRFADLFGGMPENVTFHGVDLKKQSLHEIVKGLGKFDAVADMHSVLRSFYIRSAMLLKGARVASIDKGRSDKRKLTSGKIHSPLKHTTERYAEVFKTLHLPISDREWTDVGPMLDRERLVCLEEHLPKTGVGIAPFAAHQGKIYPIERMERVVAMLSERGVPVTLFGGGKNEMELLGSWAARYKGVESVAGKYRLAQELERIRGLKLMVTMDSGNMHLASLVGTRVISIWGATHPFAGFLGYGQKESDCIQRDLECRPCSIYGNKPCKFGDYRCMDIAPEEVAQTILKAYDDRA